VPASLEEHSSLAAPFPWKNDGHFEPLGGMPYLDLPPLIIFGETLFYGPYNTEIFNVTATLGFAQRDQEIPAVTTFLVAVNDYARRTLVIRQTVAISPGIILKSNNMILVKLDLLSFFYYGSLSLRI
jgi:hypothetical protein